MKLEAWQILSMTAIQKQELVDSLDECVKALAAHIESEVRREASLNCERVVAAADLCPCTTTTLARAKKILAEVKVKP